jgi:hypothetical protein
LNKYYQGDPQKYKELIPLVRESNNTIEESEINPELSAIKDRQQQQSHISLDIKPIELNSAMRYTNESDLRAHLKNLEPLKDTYGSAPLTPKAKEIDYPVVSFGPDEDAGISATTQQAKPNMFEALNKPQFEMRELSSSNKRVSVPVTSSHQTPKKNSVLQSPSTATSYQTITPHPLLQSPNNLEKILNLKTSQTYSAGGVPTHEITGSPEWVTSLKDTMNKMKIKAEISPIEEPKQNNEQNPIPERKSVSVVSREVQTDVYNSLNTSQVIENKGAEALQRTKFQDGEGLDQVEKIEVKQTFRPDPENSEIKVIEGQYYPRDNEYGLPGSRNDTEESAKKTNQTKDRGNSVEFTLEEKEQKNDDYAYQSPRSSPKKPGITEASLTSAQFKMYNNENLIEIEHLISPDIRSLIYQKPDMVVLEGELLKYKPGITHTYVKRWARITASHFQYFKSRYGANCWDDKPLFSVAFSDLRAAYRVNMKLPKNAKIEGSKSPIQSTKGPKIAPEIYHLEIFPNNLEVPYDDENILLRNVVKREDIPTIGGDLSQIEHHGSKLYSPNRRSIQVLNVKHGHLMPSPAKEKVDRPSYSGRKSEKRSPSKELITSLRPSIKASAVSVEGRS